MQYAAKIFPFQATTNQSKSQNLSQLLSYPSKAATLTQCPGFSQANKYTI